MATAPPPYAPYKIAGQTVLITGECGLRHAA